MADFICARCGKSFGGDSRGRRSLYCSPECRNPYTLTDRFWQKVDKRGTDECWPWTGAKTYGGYGIIGGGKYPIARASRLSFELHKGPIESGAIVRHTCDNPPCVNPAHLLIGTHQDNTNDMLSRGRQKFASSRLTKEQIEEIKNSTEPCRILAEKYGVFFTYISLIRRGKRLKSVMP